MSQLFGVELQEANLEKLNDILPCATGLQMAEIKGRIVQLQTGKKEEGLLEEYKVLNGLLITTLNAGEKARINSRIKEINKELGG